MVTMKPGTVAVTCFLLFVGASALFWKCEDLIQQHRYKQQTHEARIIHRALDRLTPYLERDYTTWDRALLIRQHEQDVVLVTRMIDVMRASKPRSDGDWPQYDELGMSQMYIDRILAVVKFQLAEDAVEIPDPAIIRQAEIEGRVHLKEHDLSKYKLILSLELVTNLIQEEPHLPHTRLRPSPERQDEAAGKDMLGLRGRWKSFRSPTFQRPVEYHMADTISDELYAAHVDDCRRSIVQQAMLVAWRAYGRHAWGFDELLPSLHKGTNNYGGLGVSIVESLDTLYIMGSMEEFEKATEWIAANLHFDESRSVSVSETTSRVLGGLLSAYDLSGRTLFLTKAQELAQKLLIAWRTPSGIPMNNVDLALGTATNPLWTEGSNTLADLGAGQLELVALGLRAARRAARTTPECRFLAPAWEVLRKMKQILPADGLLPMCISTDSGKPTCTRITFGAGGGNFYADLLKIWIMSGKNEVFQPVRDMWEQSMEGLLSLVFQSTPSSYAYIAERWGTNHTILEKMDEVACFAPGMLALGADDASPAKAAQYMQTAEELAKTCYSFYFAENPHAARENYVYFSKSGEEMLVGSKFNPLKKTKTIESFFYLYRKTGDAKYKDWAWDVFQTFKSTSGGYAGSPTAFEVFPTMDSFFLANTLKFMYLLYSPSSVMPLDQWVFNTQGHPIKSLGVQHAGRSNKEPETDCPQSQSRRQISDSARWWDWI